MKPYLQTTLIRLVISLLLWGSAVNAAPPTSRTSGVKYYRYDVPSDPEGQKYHRFLPGPAPEDVFYDTRLKASANINDTPEKETIVSILVDRNSGAFAGNWAHAFLLIAETDALLKKKVLFRLYASDTHELEVPGEVSIKLQSPRFTFRDRPNEAVWKPHGVPFKLVDLTGDGTLDIWVKFGYAVAVISFQKGEFKEVLSSYSVGMHQPEYVDLDNNGIYEIKIPNNIFIKGVPRAAYPEWVSLYEWDGTTYVLNNQKFYKNNNEIYKKLLTGYHHLKNVPYGQTVEVMEAYEFYLGLAHYYRGTPAMAKGYLQRVVQKAENKDYIKAAKAILKKLPLE